jgi:hypothetical protein
MSASLSGSQQEAFPFSAETWSRSGGCKMGQITSIRGAEWTKWDRRLTNS